MRYTTLLYALTVVTILAYVTEGPVHPLYYIYTLTVKNRVPCIITLLGGVLNVVGMFVLVRYTNMGIYSIVITTTIITTVTSMITNPPYMAHCLKLKWYTFYPMLLINIIGSVIVPAILKYTRNVYYIGNLEFAKLVPGEAHFYNLDGDEIEKQTTEIKWDAEAAEKGGFEHFMMKEIHEQPKAVQDTLNSVIKNGARENSHKHPDCSL